LPSFGPHAGIIPRAVRARRGPQARAQAPETAAVVAATGQITPYLMRRLCSSATAAGRASGGPQGGPQIVVAPVAPEAGWPVFAPAARHGIGGQLGCAPVPASGQGGGGAGQAVGPVAAVLPEDVPPAMTHGHSTSRESPVAG
jgi:hypothetical protein